MKQSRFTCVVRVAVLMGLSMAFLAGARLAGQAADPFFGVWKLDVARSTFSPGPAPKTATATIEPAGEGSR